MTAPVVYRERTVPGVGDPLAAAARFARGAAAPVTVYEQDGEWRCGSGALAEIVLYWDEIRYRTDGGWRVEPVEGSPLRALARVLSVLPIADWRACGWAGFELGPRELGLPGPVSADPLAHLVIPAREARLSATGALLRAADPADLDALAAILTGADAAVAGEARPLADLEHDADEYRRTVARAVEDIAAGRIRKVIASRVVPVEGEIDLVATYELGRRGNTPARSFLVDLAGERAIGFSPETVVEVSADGRVSSQPLAGTRALLGDDGDAGRRDDLLRDPKEIYEHAVSVQAVQDELRPLCAPGTLVVDEFMNVLERGSVQHLASRVSGRLVPGKDGWDALAAVFPSITATGVPKDAACAAIRGYEPRQRALYSGAVISATSDGAIDAALVLRTVFQRDGRTWLRAGAGIVGASRPERELEETREKLRSVSRFLVPARPPVAPAPAAVAPGSGLVGSVAAEDLEALRRAVAELLEEDPAALGDQDNLFELGLESIALIKAIGQWRRAGIEVNFAELAETPTLDGWFKLLTSRRPSAPPRTEAEAGTGTTPAAVGPVGSAAAEPEAGAEFPLALMQHAYWVGRAAGQTYGGVAAHIYTEFDGSGLEPARLSAAIERLVERHEALRTRITDNGGQVVEPVSGWRGLTVHDLRDLDEDTATARLAAVRDALSHQMLDIERGEVFSTALSLRPGGATRFHLDVDMVAADAVSYRVLLADLADLYERPDDVAPPLAYSYRRYRAEHGAARPEAVTQARAAWLDRLPSLPGAPQLALASTPVATGGTGEPATPGDPAAVPRVSRRHFQLPPSAREALGRAAHQRGVTPAMAVATAFAEVLGGWSAQPRFLLNVPLFDREQLHPDVNRVVGDFTSSVLLEIDLTDSVPFVDRSRQVQARLHADAAHADYSGVEVLRDLGRRHGEPVLAPVVFTSALGLGELFDAPVRREFGQPVWIISQGPQVLLDAQVTELDGGLLVNWDIREGSFAPGVVDAMFAAFERLVRDLADLGSASSAGGGAWDQPVDGLLDESTRAVRRRVAATAGPASTRLLHEGFFAAARSRPDAPALLWDEPASAPGAARSRSLSYGELAERATAVAGALIARGTRRGELVGVSLPKGPDQVVAVLGVLAAGATYVPVGVEQPPARVAQIAATAGLRTVIALPAGQEWPAGVTPLRLDDAREAAPRGALTLGAADDPHRLDEPAYVLFTSGSTGQPKGVEVGHRAAMNTIDDLIDRLGLGPADRTLAVSALDFDLSVFDVFAPLSCGGAVVIVDEESRREATRWAELIAGGVTILNCVPAVLDLVLSTGVPLGHSLRAVLLGGDRVGVDLPGRLEAAVPGCRFLGLGGTTETAIHSTVCEVAGGGPVPPEWRSVPYGTPLRNVALRVVDALGRDCPDHVAGELWIGGAGVARGYRGDPERTADRFVTHEGARWYRTGDLARYQSDGTVEFLGRRDHQVKIKGFRVELGEIEAALGSVPGVRAGVAALTPGAAGRPPALGAVVVLTAGTDEARAQGAVQAGLRALLPPHMVPDRVVVVAELPLSANGKIDRRAVGTLLEREQAGPRPASAPARSDLERVIQSVWREVLDVGEFGVDEEFFALGGDSVLATSVVARLREELDTGEVTVRMVFGAPTVAGLADGMRAAEATPGRLDRVAAIAWEIAALSDDEIEARLLDVAEQADAPEQVDDAARTDQAEQVGAADVAGTQR
ncbi:MULTISPECIES: salicylate synthase [Pseudofrankia]|uniref:salicylate synthase n=1 Tax=Pseudofrankia TaxID=2994363 RepID=UPI000234B3FA|nr:MULTISPECIES: salicylate synthase [Pseudofrankia]OHV29632.1 salicylate synthase [Pseudofrankia sp. EUN1h]